MPECDEDLCNGEAKAICTNFGVQLCLDHCGGDGSECLDCGATMEGL